MKGGLVKSHIGCQDSGEEGLEAAVLKARAVYYWELRLCIKHTGVLFPDSCTIYGLM